MLEFRNYKSLINEISIGEQLPDALYIHESAINVLSKALGKHIAKTIEVLDLKDYQDLQEDVLTLYHLSTIAFERSATVKSVASSNGRSWIKNMLMNNAPH